MRELRGNSVDASHDFEQCRAIRSQTLPEDGKRIKLGVTKTKTLRSENVNVESSDRDGISGRQVWLRTRRRRIHLSCETMDAGPRMTGRPTIVARGLPS